MYPVLLPYSCRYKCITIIFHFKLWSNGRNIWYIEIEIYPISLPYSCWYIFYVFKSYSLILFNGILSLVYISRLIHQQAFHVMCSPRWYFRPLSLKYQRIHISQRAFVSDSLPWIIETKEGAMHRPGFNHWPGRCISWLTEGGEAHERRGNLLLQVAEHSSK